MTPGLSIWLDIVRFCAAVAVFAFHLSLLPFSTGFLAPGLLLHDADIAIAIFFVLSGFVIAYVVEVREKSLAAFFVGRASRLWSVVVPALFVTLAFDFVGSHINPSFYANSIVLLKPESFSGYLSSLFFVNEYWIFGFHGIEPGVDGPLWSLSFEATYYLIAGLFLFAPRKWSIPLSLVLLACGGRTLAAMFPIWIAGFLLFRALKKFRLDFVLATAIFFLSMVLLLYVPIITHRISDDNFGVFFPYSHWVHNRNIVQDYLAALCFVLNLGAAGNIFVGSEFVRGKVSALVRWLGEMTFPLYCLHFPVICLLGAVSPWTPDSWANFLYLVSGVFLFVIALTPLTAALRVRLRRLLGDAQHNFRLSAKPQRGET